MDSSDESDASVEASVVPGTTDARGRILDAAARLFVEHGADGVTIAAVARAAGVSKGGLFYHFASKEALIEGLVDRYVESFDRLITAAGDTPGAATLAWLDSAGAAEGPADRATLAMLAAAASSPRALAALQERYRIWQCRLEDDGVPADIAALIRATVDGLWFADAFDLSPAPTETRLRVLSRLRALVEQQI
ncbi:MAG: TetR/AcrR family transcriptional regulator [Acidipropionibacterium sp.]|jgi:AcrR family transcriptional regulator|nr:TetR/AcrR family transcriptional regulator [Acidipropionibacterium sp.]